MVHFHSQTGTVRRAGADAISILARLRRARRRTDELFALLPDASFTARPIPERHRLVFYLGHLDAFDWNLIGRELLGAGPHDPLLDGRFAFGIDPAAGELPRDDASEWPAVNGVRAYVLDLRERLDALLRRAFAVGGDDETRERVSAAIEHRLMHAETLAYLIHSLPRSAKLPHAVEVAVDSPGRRGQLSSHVRIPAGGATLGRTRGTGFGWDNEFDGTVEHVPAFAIDRFPVTNGEFAGFVAAGGYDLRELWDDAGWNWKTAHGVAHPHFWFEENGRWLQRGMFEDRPVPLEWPVYVSHAEANAYARWRGAALPTEAQWHRAACGTDCGEEREHPWGDGAPTAEHGNFDFQRFDPTPVDAHPLGASAFGVEDLAGNGWEWTSSVFAPLPGFVAQEFYPRYSAPFFDDAHYVLKGGSSRTAKRFLRRSFRNWFRPHHPYVYAKFRCVENAS